MHGWMTTWMTTWMTEWIGRNLTVLLLLAQPIPQRRTLSVNSQSLKIIKEEGRGGWGFVFPYLQGFDVEGAKVEIPRQKK